MAVAAPVERDRHLGLLRHGQVLGDRVTGHDVDAGQLAEHVVAHLVVGLLADQDLHRMTAT